MSGSIFPHAIAGVVGVNQFCFLINNLVDNAFLTQMEACRPICMWHVNSSIGQKNSCYQQRFAVTQQQNAIMHN